MASSTSTRGTQSSMMSQELWRYLTFRFYPVTAGAASSSLAARGFVYIGSGTDSDDSVMCFFCEKQHRNWRVGDDIDDIHRRLSPTCPMVTGATCSNIPMLNPFENISSENSNDNNPMSLIINQFESEVAVRNEIQSNLDQIHTSNNTAAEQIATFAASSQNSEVETADNTTPEEVATFATSSENTEVVQTDSSQSVRRQSSLEQTHQPTYQELAIITEKPKRQELAIKAVRLQTYQKDWPTSHHLTVDDLSSAGFYFAGYGDCTRCFFCGGGLRNWDREDNVWVEHARWFPRCAYMRQVKGLAFIEAVKRLNDQEKSVILYDEVTQEMGAAAQVQLLENDPAVVAVLDLGCFELQEVMHAAEAIIEDGNDLTSEKLFERLEDTHGPRDIERLDPQTVQVSEERIATLTPEIQTLRQARRCKVCLDKEVSVIYLPCGHFCTCGECAPSCEVCPICRQAVRGVVRASMPESTSQQQNSGNITSHQSITLT